MTNARTANISAAFDSRRNALLSQAAQAQARIDYIKKNAHRDPLLANRETLAAARETLAAAMAALRIHDAKKALRLAQEAARQSAA